MISILVPSFNHADYLTELMQSIWRQPCRELEIILVDDGSSDGSFNLSQQLARSSPVPMQVHKQENRGINSALNRALSLASGEYVAIIASDDFFAEDRFSGQRQLMESRPEVQLVYGNGRYWRNGKVLKRVHGEAMQQLLRQKPEAIRDYLVTHVPALLIQSCLFRADFLRRIGGFDEHFLSDDWPLNIRMFSVLEPGAFEYVDADVFYYRQHASNGHKHYALHSRRILEVINHYTPEHLRSAFLAEQHARLAMLALSDFRFGQGFLHVLESQRRELNLWRVLTLLFKLVRYPFKRIYGFFR